MKRNTIVIIGIIGLLAIVCLAVAAFFLANEMPFRMIRHLGYGNGPGMMNGQSGAETVPGEPNVEPAEGSPVPTNDITPINPVSTEVSEIIELPENTMMQKAGNMTVLLAISPYPPVRSKLSSFDVTLKDENGGVIFNATVFLDLTMPAMWMPANKFEAKAIDNGLYHGTGRFTMGGLWQIEVLIQQGTEKESAFFSIEL